MRFNSRALLPCLLTSLACGQGESAPGDASEFITWAAEHAVALEEVDAPLPSPAIEALRESIGDARLVGIGESRHDTREQLLVKGRLVRHLVEDLGFRALILEESVSHAEGLERYLATGEGELREVVNGLAGWYLWDTEEMLTVFAWIREFNEGREAKDQVRLAGMDVTAPAAGVRVVLAALKEAGVETKLEATALGLEFQDGDYWPVSSQRYAALDEDRRFALSDRYDELVDSVLAARDSLVAATSEDAFARLLRLAEVGRQGYGVLAATGIEEGGAIREHAMTEVVLDLLDRELTGRRTILWAHNLHVARAPFTMPAISENEMVPMGVHLDEALGNNYLTIGASFGAGAYGPEFPPGEQRFEVLGEDTVDGALATIGAPPFLLDLRRAEPESFPARYLDTPRDWRAQGSLARCIPSASFDLVFYVDEITRARPTPLARDRYAELGAGR